MALGKAAWGQPFPVDPGKHFVRTMAPGMQAFATTVQVDPSSTVSVEVTSMQRIPVSNASELTPGTSRVSDPDRLETSRRNSATGSTQQRWLGIGTGTIGVIALGIGTGYALRSASKSSDAEHYRHQGTNIYDEPGFALDRQALAARNFAIACAVTGAVAAAGGIVIYLTAPASKAGARSASSGPTLQLHADTVTLAGSWQ